MFPQKNSPLPSSCTFVMYIQHTFPSRNLKLMHRIWPILYTICTYLQVGESSSSSSKKALLLTLKCQTTTIFQFFSSRWQKKLQEWVLCVVKSLIPSNFLPSFSHFLKVEEDIKVKLYLERIEIEQRNDLCFIMDWRLISISKYLENSDCHQKLTLEMAKNGNWDN